MKAHSIPRQLVPLLALAASPAATAFAQTHLLVPSQFAEIGLAVQAANPGDIIEVVERIPHYLPFVLDRPVTIVGSAGEHRAPTVAVTQGVGIDIQLAPGERAVLSRIDVRAETGAVATTAVQIQGGAVTFEDCRFRSGDDLAGNTAVLDALDTELSALFCRFEGGRGGTALRASNCRVAITDSRCFGGIMPAGDGIVVHDCALHTSGAWLIGGDEFLGGPGGTGLRVSGSAVTTIRRGSATGGFGQPGGGGLVNTGANPVESTPNAFAGGTDPQTGVAAPATTGPTVINPDLVGLTWSEPPYRRGTLRPGQPWAASVHAAPNSIALLAFAFSASGFAPVITRQPALLPQDVALIVPVLTSSLGHASFGGTLPNDPTLRGTILWGQAVAGPSLPLEASPPSAVVVR